MPTQNLNDSQYVYSKMASDKIMQETNPILWHYAVS